MQGQGRAPVRGKGDLACVSNSSLSIMPSRPRGSGGSAGQVMAVAEVRVTTYPIH
jgi:hypothetical protein